MIYCWGDSLDLVGLFRLMRVVFYFVNRICWGSYFFILFDGCGIWFEGKELGIEGVMKINDYCFVC